MFVKSAISLHKWLNFDLPYLSLDLQNYILLWNQYSYLDCMQKRRFPFSRRPAPGSTDAQAIKTALEATSDFAGITGSITLGPDAHIPRKGVTMIAIKNGKFTLGAELIPEEVPAP